MTLPTIEEQLEYLRAPGSPTAVNAWCYHPIYGFVQEAAPGSRGEPSREYRRALRERAFWEWYSNLKNGWTKQTPDFHGCAVDPHSRKIVTLESSSLISIRLRGDEIARLSRLEMDREQAARAAYDHLFPEDSNTQKKEHNNGE